MKMNPQDFSKLKAYLKTWLDNNRQEAQEIRDFAFSHKVPNGNIHDPEMFTRWTIFHRCGLKLGNGIGVRSNFEVYSYLDDEHIDTALKRALSEIDAGL